MKDHGASTDTIAALKTKTDSVIAAIQKTQKEQATKTSQWQTSEASTVSANSDKEKADVASLTKTDEDLKKVQDDNTKTISTHSTDLKNLNTQQTKLISEYAQALKDHGASESSIAALKA